MTLSADWWHIDMRDIVAVLGAQTIILANPPPSTVGNNGSSTVVGPGGQTVVRAASDGTLLPNGQLEPGPVVFTIDPNANLSGAILEGLDYEAIYILDSSIFGHGDWGRLTTTINGPWLSRFELHSAPGPRRLG